MRRCYSFALLVLALCAIPTLIFAQGPGGNRPEEKPLSISGEDRQNAITAILKEFDERYVFPEVGAKVREQLTAKLKDKGYDSLNTGQDLAKALTKDLQAITNDKHVRVNCSTETLPKRSEKQEGPSPEEMKRFREELRIRNAGFVKVERLPGNIGYIKLNNFVDPEAGREPLQAAMMFLKNTDALIIDLRHNGGGTPLMIRDLCSYFFEKSVHINSMYFRKGNRKEEFWTNKDVPGPRYLHKDVYLLTSAFTFSGAEECAYNFQTQKRGTIVGEITGGGAHPGGTIPVADHYLIFIPTGRAINPITNTNWEGVGVKPDVLVDADKALDTAQELAVKKLCDSKDEVVAKRVRDDVEGHKRMSKRIEERRLENIKSRQDKQ